MPFSNSCFFEQIPYFIRALQQSPSAAAQIKGGPNYPAITGTVCFYQTSFGVLVSAQIWGLPTSDELCKKRIFAFHIHSGSSCTGNQDDAFANALTHYNPNDCKHPNHAGDLLPLWGNDNGYAFELFLTDRFSVSQVVGKTLILHANPDDFTTQPSGNAGEKIACGIIARRPPCCFTPRR